MTSTTGTSPPDPNGGPTSTRTDRSSTARADTLSVRRLNIMRVGYAVMGVGLAVTQWPMLFTRSEPWPLYEGVTTTMLIAMGLLALLGLRHPRKMLPILLFESAWKVIWLTVVARPLITADTMDAATSEMASDILWVVIVLAVIPWRYVLAHYVTAKGDPWRSGARAQSSA